MSDWWSTLRGVLSAPPSAASWQGLWQHLLLAPKHEHGHIVEYINAHLAQWPATLRVVSLSEAHRTLTDERGECLDITRCLQLDQDLPSKSFQPLAEWLAQSDITHLQNTPKQISPSFLLDVLRTMPLGSFVSLSLDAIPLGDKTLGALARIPKMSQLQSLSLRHCSIREAGMLELTRSPYLNLRSLALKKVGSGRHRLSELFRSPLVHDIETLRLEGDKIETKAITALCQTSQCNNLVSLTCCDSQLGDREARLLANANNLPSLVYLDLSRNNISSIGMAALSDSPQFANLHELRLDGNPCCNKP